MVSKTHAGLALLLAAATFGEPDRAQAASVAASAREAFCSAAESALRDSAEGWNTGDLDRFMGAYAEGADISYLNASGLVVGYDAIKAAYKPRVAAFHDAGGNGKLRIETVRCTLVAPSVGVLIGRFHLTFADRKEISGWTSLVFVRHGQDWKIVADHS